MALNVQTTPIPVLMGWSGVEQCVNLTLHSVLKDNFGMVLAASIFLSNVPPPLLGSMEDVSPLEINVLLEVISTDNNVSPSRLALPAEFGMPNYLNALVLTLLFGMETFAFDATLDRFIRATLDVSVLPKPSIMGVHALH